MLRNATCSTFIVLALCLAAWAPAGAQESDGAQSAEKMDSLQASLENRKLGRALSDYVFASRTAEPEAESVESDSPFLAHSGLVIRNIEIFRYNILSDTPVGSKNPDMPAVVRAIEKIHIDTHISKIESFLLFEEGDRLNPFEMADSERLLRGTSFIQDARLIVTPVPGSADSVDVKVVTRDVWSIGVRYSWITVDRHRVKFYERNLAGYGQTLEWEISLDRTRDRKADHTFYYGAPNIYGTFISGSVRWVDAVAYRYNQWKLSRGYISPAIRWIGGASIEGMDDVDDDPASVRKWDRQDLWIGRSFRLFDSGEESLSRRRIVPAVRVTRTDHHVRPEVSEERNRGYHDRVAVLGGLSLTKRSFRKTRMVFSFGKTEDIPYGYLATISGGESIEEFYNRPYGGIDLTWTGFVGASGYLAARGAFGGYYRNDSLEDGTLSLAFGGFSSLLPFYRSVARHFFVVDYIYGYNRLPNNTVRLEEPRGGLRGLSNTGVRGHQRLMLRWEGILFIDWDWWGFRFATFAYTEAGEAGPDWNSFVDGRYWLSLGGGFRLHNERLIFDAYEVRFMHHPSVPEGADTQTFRFEAVRNIDIPFLSPGAPRVIRYE